MAQATTWRTAHRVPNTLLSDAEESVAGTQWRQNATSFLEDMLVEVARRSTERNDGGDKRCAYEAIGLPEYIVFDPNGDVLRGPLRAWRLQSDVSIPWQAAPDGWWYSQSLGISFQPTQPFLTVRDRNNRPLGLSRQGRERAEYFERRLDEVEQERAEAEQERAEAVQARAEEALQRIEAEQVRIKAERERAVEAQRRAALEEERRRLREQNGEQG